MKIAPRGMKIESIRFSQTGKVLKKLETASRRIGDSGLGGRRVGVGCSVLGSR